MDRSNLIRNVAVLGIVVAAFIIRLMYLLNSHPFFDEFTTILAAQAILQRGIPALPSGLFYEHGLLFSYLDAPFVALADQELLFVAARLPSLLLGTVTVLLLYWVGRRWLSPRAGLIAAGLLAFSPEGMVWSGRARMYTLAQLLVLLLAYLVYEGSRGHGDDSSQPRWLALAVLLAALLTQLGALIMVPPLLVGALMVGWLTRRTGLRPWFLRPSGWLEGVGLAVVVALGILVKRLGQPFGAEPLAIGGSPVATLAGELISTITYQAGLVLDGEGALKFLAREFGVPHHLWLTLVTVTGGVLALVGRVRAHKLTSRWVNEPGDGSVVHAAYVLPYVGVVFGLTVLEMIVLLEPWRRNPRYLVLALPLFYLLAAAGVERIASFISADLRIRRLKKEPSNYLTILGPIMPVFVFILVQAVLLVPDVRSAYRTPEPAYEDAFRYVAAQWQPGDVVLTMNTSAAGLLLAGSIDRSADTLRFAMQDDADQFLLSDGAKLVDRWLGAPWIGTAAEFNRVLNEHARVWFVVDTVRLPVYYRGDWLSILGSQMDQVWSLDNALVYLSRADRSPVPANPDVSLDVRFGDAIRLEGYSLARQGDHSVEAKVMPCDMANVLCLGAGDDLQITLFWQALKSMDVDYTVFVHLRDAQGMTPAQRDSQPFDGLYPTSQWQPGETIIQPLELDLPPDLPAGSYKLYVGLYQLDTMARLPIQNDTSGENAAIFGQVVRIMPDQ